MSHHNNKPTGKEPNLNAKDALRKATGHIAELHGIVQELSHLNWKAQITSRLWNRLLVLIEEVEILAPLFQKELSKGARKDLENLSKEFADYSADGQHRIDTYAKDFEARKETLDKTLLHLLSEFKAA